MRGLGNRRMGKGIGFADKYWNKNKIRMLKWIIKKNKQEYLQRQDEDPFREFEDSYELFDLEFKSTDWRTLYFSNLTKNGFVCLSFSNTDDRYSAEMYQIFIFEVSLDLQIKNKRMLRGDERQETLDRLIYFGDGKLSICRRDEKIKENYATFLEIDLCSGEVKRLFDVDLEAKFPAVCCGDAESGYSVAFSTKGIWKLEPSSALNSDEA